MDPAPSVPPSARRLAFNTPCAVSLLPRPRPHRASRDEAAVRTLSTTPQDLDRSTQLTPIPNPTPSPTGPASSNPVKNAVLRPAAARPAGPLHGLCAQGPAHAEDGRRPPRYVRPIIKTHLSYCFRDRVGFDCMCAAPAGLGWGSLVLGGIALGRLHSSIQQSIRLTDPSIHLG